MDQTLYERLGGRETIALVVGGLYDRLLTDPEIAPVFSGIDMSRLRHHMTIFLSAALGSETVYAGRDMAAAHAGLQITDAMFDQTVAYLIDTLESAGVASEEVQSVTTTVAPLRSQVVHGGALA